MDVVVVTRQLSGTTINLSHARVLRPMAEHIAITVNGEARSVISGTTVAALIGELGFGDRRVAVERNLEVVPRAQHATTVLGNGDRLEVVTFVGGG
jgi:sulfur carrier protein